MENFGRAIRKSIIILIAKIFIMPIKVLKTSINGINESSKDAENTQFPLFMWVKNMYEALIVLCYPLGLLGQIFYAIDGGSFGDFLMGVIILYFIPLALGLIKEAISITIINVVKLEEIARNTKKN